jgi:predicted DNA-binding transcriptional regulator YafY
MPSNKNAVTRHRIIDQCLINKRYKYPTLEYLADRCSEILETDISTSTIEKDIALMKKDSPVGYNAPIIYSKQHKGYAYSEIGFSISELNLQDEEWNALRFSAQLLYQYRDVPVFANFKNAIERINTRFTLGIDAEDPIINEHVAFEKGNSVSGMDWIDLIYDAIKNKYSLKLTYKNIYKKKTSDYLINPYLLKEHRNRWYVVGWGKEKNDYVTFGLDRILSVEVIAVKQNDDARERAAFKPEKFFQYATGIMEGGGKPQLVELIITEPLSHLVLLDPIHHTQKLLGEKNGEIRINMTVYVNEEFCLRLLGMGPWCTVSKPASLKATMKGLIQKMHGSYR